MFFQPTEETKHKQKRFKELLISYKNKEITSEEFKNHQIQDRLLEDDLFSSSRELQNLCFEIGLAKEDYQNLKFMTWMS
jgi:hypothetical protein